MNHPDGLAARGQRLWNKLNGDDSDGMLRELIIEACRTVDRLDKLDWATRRDGIIDLVERGDTGETMEISIGNAMGEARQQGAALRQLLADISRRTDAVAPPPSAGDDILDDL